MRATEIKTESSSSSRIEALSHEMKAHYGTGQGEGEGENECLVG